MEMKVSFGNKFMMFLINSPLGGLMGQSMAVITVSGRKTGKLISTPINVVKEGSDFYVISSRDRTWWRNLRGDSTANLRVAGKNHKVTGKVLDSIEEIKAGLIHLSELVPVISSYLKIKIASDGFMDEGDLNRVAAERVIIKLIDHQ
jgi:deazaflavin-dependent oxidoreductase (nitroreductase family)